MPNSVSGLQWSALSAFVAETMGLHFPCERWADLRRGLSRAARELGFEDVADFVEALLTAPVSDSIMQTLASHLTVGETYFFREKKTFEVLANRVLPELIRSRRGREQRLRFWSAGCCTGEEPYSLAILLHQLIPDLSQWHVTILATDLNTRFLRKALIGLYGEWSFRDTPAWLKERYFSRAADGRYAILPEIKKLVTFQHLNLVDHTHCSPAADTNAIDVICCRNVMMYFAATQVRKVIRNFHHALVDGGWLAVSPSEASHALFPQFVAANYPGVILYQRSDAKVRAEQGPMPVPLEGAAELVTPTIGMPSLRSLVPVSTEPAPAPPAEEGTRIDAPSTPVTVAKSHYQEGRYADAVDTLLAANDEQASEPAFSLLVHSLANLGKLADALSWCERWIAADKLNPAPHYLHAVILLEQSAADQARTSLQRALYLQPDFVLAHFALGNIARGSRKSEESRRHFTNALQLLGGCQPHEILPVAEGLTAGRLREIITSMIKTEAAP
jgi:chemotaxis protein methyltransferase CheR